MLSMDCKGNQEIAFLFSRGMIKGEVAEVYREFKSLVEKKKLFREGEKACPGSFGRWQIPWPCWSSCGA